MTTIRLVVMAGTYVGGTIPPTFTEYVEVSPGTYELQTRYTIGDRFNSPVFQWARRLNGLFEPDRTPVTWCWMHEAAPINIATLTPNAPSAGKTQIDTVPFPVFYDVGTTVRVKFRATGIAELDDADVFLAEVMQIGTPGAAGTPSVLVIHDYIAPAAITSPQGTISLGYAQLYDGDRTGSVDTTHGGTYPSRGIGPDYRMMQVLQDALSASNTDDPVVLVQLGTNTESLRGRTDEQDGRWLQEFASRGLLSDGTNLPERAFLSQFADLRSILENVRAFYAHTVGVEITDFEVVGLVIGHGLNEGNIGDEEAVRRRRTVAEIELDGADLLVTTTAAHGVLAHTTKAWEVGVLAGLDTDPDGVSGLLHEVERVDDTQLRIREFVASDAPTFEPGVAVIEIGDPGWFFEDDILGHVDSLRAMLAELFPAQEADEIQTVLLIPNHGDPNAIHDSARGVLARMPGRRLAVSVVDLADEDRASDPEHVYQARELLGNAEVSFALIGPTWYMERPDGGLSGFRLFSFLIVAFEGEAGSPYVVQIAGIVSDTLVALSANVGGAQVLEGIWSRVLTNRTGTASMVRIVRAVSRLYFSLEGVLRTGEDIAAEILAPSAPALLAAKTPAIVVACIGDSYITGHSALTYLLDNDPDLIASPDAPHVGQRVWNSSSQAWEDVRLYLDGAVPSANLNTHPEWNYGALQAGAATVGPQMALLHALRERYPDEVVHLVNLGVNGSVLATPTLAVNPQALSRAILTTDFLLVELATPATHFAFNRDIVVALEGVTGLAPDPNGIHLDARPQYLTGSSNLWVAVPGRFTGTPNVSAATVSFRAPVWNPSAAEVWSSFERELRAAYEALWQAGFVPDARLVFVALGVNDAGAQSHEDFANALDEFVPALRDLMQTQGKPREFGELPIVWLNPIVHDGLDAGKLERLLVVRDALSARRAADAYFRLLTLDEQLDWLLDPAAIAADEVHPTFRGTQEIGYRLARLGADLIPGYPTRHPVDFTPQVPGGVVP